MKTAKLVNLFVTQNDSDHAKAMAVRWGVCSEAAQHFAAYYHSQFGENILPHVVAEMYDNDPLMAQLAIFGEERTFNSYDKRFYSKEENGVNGG